MKHTISGITEIMFLDYVIFITRTIIKEIFSFVGKFIN